MTTLLKTILISVITLILFILGDYYIKKASLLKEYSGLHFLLLGTTIYFISAFGLFWVYRSYKFLTVGAIQSFGFIILTTLVSQIIFKEKINSWEIFGLILGVFSLTILLYNGKLQLRTRQQGMPTTLLLNEILKKGALIAVESDVLSIYIVGR